MIEGRMHALDIEEGEAYSLEACTWEKVPFRGDPMVSQEELEICGMCIINLKNGPST